MVRLLWFGGFNEKDSLTVSVIIDARNGLRRKYVVNSFASNDTTRNTSRNNERLTE